ncbi:MAG: GNAT family N-acetyltransferase [Chloroflexota bacterium]
MDTLKNLGDGLSLRWSTPEDTEKIAKLVGDVFRNMARNNEDDSPNFRMMDQISIVMRGDFPYQTPYDIAVVEDTHKPERPIVACSCLWQHTWNYGSIPFTAGRPEIVATDPAYRNRGLVRHIFALLHERSDGRGDLMQGITGIPYFYRQFGYEMVLDLDVQGKASVAQLPEKKADEQELCILRPATLDDIPVLTTLHNQNRGDSLIWHEASEDFWRYIINYWSDPSNQRQDRTLVGINLQAHLILDSADNILGMVVLGHHRWRSGLGVYELALAEQTNLHRILPSLLRALRAYGEQCPTMFVDAPAFSEISFWLGRTHPLYDLIGADIAPRDENFYAWYIRVPNVPAFIHKIAPVLEKRLAQSIFTDHTGELCIDFYRGGLRLVFDQGKLTVAEPWQSPAFEGLADAGFPPLIFLQLLLGYRSLTELNQIFPDVKAKENVRLLIDTLFPKQHSLLMPMG